MEMERHKFLKAVSKLLEFLLVVNISENFISGKLIELERLCEDIALVGGNVWTFAKSYWVLGGLNQWLSVRWVSGKQFDRWDSGRRGGCGGDVGKGLFWMVWNCILWNCLGELKKEQVYFCWLKQIHRLSVLL